MNRRTWLMRALSGALLLPGSFLALEAAPRPSSGDFQSALTRPLGQLPKFDPKRSLRLEDEHCLVEVDRAHGSITRVHDKRSGLELIREPRLAGSYRFALPIPGKEPWQTLEANWVFGRDQKLSCLELSGRKLVLHWQGPLKNYLGERFDASARMILELRGGRLRLALMIDNRTPYAVGETYFPVLGGIHGLGRNRSQLKATELIRPATPSARQRNRAEAEGQTPAPASPEFMTAAIFRVFDNMSWLGDQGPEQFFVYPEAKPPPTVADAPKLQRLWEPWVGFVAPALNRSALIAAPVSPQRTLYFRLELVPASSGTVRDDGNWPRPEELGGLPVGVEFSIVDLEGAPAGKPYAAAPVFLSFLDGAGAEMSKAFASSPRD